MVIQPQDIGVKLSEVTVYGKPGCKACTATTRRLTKYGVDFKYVDYTQDAEAEAMIRSKNVLSAPFVTSPVGEWSGLDEAKIAELVDAA